MMLEASLLRFGGRGAFLNVLYVRCFAYTVSECGTKHLLLFTPFSVTFICFVNQNNDLPLSIVRSVKH